MKNANTLLTTLLLACLTMALAACGSDQPSVTGDVEELYITGARVTGSVNVSSEELANAHFGILCSSDSNVSIENYTDSVSSKSLEDNQFTVVLRHLRAATQYYYRAFTCIGGNYVYGEVKSFTTKAAKATVSLNGLEYDHATFDCTTNLEDFDLEFDGNSCGVMWSCDKLDNPEDYENAATADNVADGHYTIDVTGLQSSTTYYYCAFTFTNGIYTFSDVEQFTTDEWEDYYEEEESYVPTAGGHAYVDLGLPSGTYWATCNVGADSPEDYGNLYAWGETRTKSSYSWRRYFDSINESDRDFYRYNNKSGSPEFLYDEDDAAHVNWGADWHMPTYRQFEELINSKYTTTQWTTQNGTNGRLITSNSNGNSIFLPASGGANDEVVIDRKYNGFYWTNTPYGRNGAYIMYFSHKKICLSTHARVSGFSVRPVRADFPGH